MTLDHDDVLVAIEGAVARAPLPEALVAAVEAAPDPVTVAAAIRAEDALVTEALRLGGRVARRGPVPTVEHAIGALGAEDLVTSLVAAAVRDLCAPALDGYGLAPRALWAHAVRGALAAERLAPRAGVAPAVAFSAALLVDVGKLVANRFLGLLSRRVLLAHDRHPDWPFDVIERLVLGVDHAELGAVLAEAWGLPPAWEQAIRYHHRPEAAPADNALVAVVHAADLLASLSGHGLGIDGLLYRATSAPEPAVLRGPEDVDALLAEVERRVGELERRV